MTRQTYTSDKCNLPTGSRRSQATASSQCIRGLIRLKCNKTQLQLHQLQITGSHFAGIVIHLSGVSREPGTKSRPRDEPGACLCGTNRALANY